MRRRRHCMIVYSYYPLGETRVQRQAEALVRQGYQVDVICPRMTDEPVSETHSGVRIRRLPMQTLKSNLIVQFIGYVVFLVAAGMVLTTRHLVGRYDTVQVHNLPDFLVFSAVVPKLTGTPIVLDLHDLMPEFLASRFQDDAPGWLAKLILLQERLACRFADHVITVSEQWRTTLSERSAPLTKTSVVMNVADEQIFRKTDAPRPQTAEKMALIYHGTVVYRYGLDLVIDVIDRLASETPNLTLRIVGQGDQMEALKDQVDRLGVADRVTIDDGLVPAEELPEMIALADLGVVPYRNDVFTDGLIPTKLLEYAAMGLPAIAARTSAIEDLAGESFVHYFQPGDVDDLAEQLRFLYQNPRRREELASATEEFNARFNWAKASREYVDLISSLADRAGQSPRAR